MIMQADHKPRIMLSRGKLPRFRGRGSPYALPRERHIMRHIRAFRRTLWIVLFLPWAIAIQTVLLALPGRQKAQFAAFFWGAIARLLGLKVRVIGAPVQPGGSGSARPVIYACNHSSWMDIPALGSALQARFVSKDDVAGWPIIGTIARLGRTVFISRSRAGTLRERDSMGAVLATGDGLILFPEGTSSDGSRVLPFRSAFFAAAYGEAKPLIQPVSVVYDRLAGLPVGHVSRAVFAWYGDMSLAPHYWGAAQWCGKRVTLLFHPPLDPADYADRKALALAAWQSVAEGAAALRQNRPVRPAVELSVAATTNPAFA
jgi:1-acyl-sn-glycerol-3-phosphate acyltransferase